MSPVIRLPIPDPATGLRARPGPAGSTLVCPSKGKHDWTPEEVGYRSVLLASDGEVLSIGFDKFFTVGEAAAEPVLRGFRDRLARGDPVEVTEKLDGSLIVRSVVAGRVLLRTRGTTERGEHVALAEALVAERHPALLDADRFADVSLLLELTTARPDLRVVIEHPDDRLRLLAVRRHADLRFADGDEVDRVAAACGLERPEVVPVDDLDALVATVAAWGTGREGVVLAAPDPDAPSGRAMLKLKSHRYLVAHRLLDDLAGAGLVDLCAEHAVTTSEELWTVVEALGLPRERLADRAWVIDAYLAAVAAAEEDLARVAAEVDAAQAAARRDGLEGRAARKALAAHVLAELPGGAQRAAAFTLADGDRERAHGLVLRERLDGLRARLREPAEA